MKLSAGAYPVNLAESVSQVKLSVFASPVNLYISCCIPGEAINIEVMEAEIDHQKQEKKDHETGFSCLEVEAICLWVSGESLCRCVSIEVFYFLAHHRK
ncbi:hypothetical protein Bca4012_023857 [Brassica carinata]